MELHILLGHPGSGKSHFSRNYCKNENLVKNHFVDFKISFGVYFDKFEEKITELNSYLEKINHDQNVFIEFPIHPNHTCDLSELVRKTLSVDWLYENIPSLKLFNFQDVFLHLFYKNDDMEFDSPLIEYQNIDGLVLHQPYLIYRTDEKIVMDKSFDWDVMNSKGYCKFKMKNKLNDFILWFSVIRSNDSIKYLYLIYNGLSLII